jgi:hypothetical protein
MRKIPAVLFVDGTDIKLKVCSLVHLYELLTGVENSSLLCAKTNSCQSMIKKNLLLEASSREGARHN